MPMPDSDEVRSTLSPIMEKFAVPGMAVAVFSGEKREALGLGVCDLEKGGTVGPDTSFQLASCSKAYTATAAAILVDAGAMTFDDPVRQHLPEFQLHDERLTSLATLRDLLSMRLGYRGEGILNWGRNLELGVDTIFERMRYLEPIAGFRELFTYLNPAYTLMSEVIARVSGKPFAEYLKEAISDPLGQNRTFIHEGCYVPDKSHAFPHGEFDDGVAPIGMAQCGGQIGESCVYSTANDAARWMAFHLGKGEADGKRIVSAEAMAEMHRPHVYAPSVPALDNHFLSYGMGWQCRDTPNGPVLLHEGGEFGVSTFTMLDPLRDNGVAVYANLNSSAAVKASTYTMIDRLAEREPRDWSSLFDTLVKQERDGVSAYYENQLAEYVQDTPEISDILGSYFHPANGVIDISQGENGIDMRLRDGWVYDCVLEPAQENLFRGPFRFSGMQALARDGMRVRFFSDDQGPALFAAGFGVARKVSDATA
ncbi:serine hydrolase [Parasphingopyxis sp.]|uniref:serine hydrolase domain-containing protein n=1 Tax=Parasphingopyxis sp. TaxID=1920299 RepID=UPI002632F2D8|nr:serine hydrolase domain-containing protein [Parasphingopyxis sp.]